MQYLISIDTYISSTVLISEKNAMKPVGTNPYSVVCLVTLSSSIGPDISALSISWQHNNQTVNTTLDEINAPNTFFNNSLALSDISEQDSGEYCCTASIAGNQTKSKNCVELKVKTNGEYCILQCLVKIFLPKNLEAITISDNFNNLRTGSSVLLMCSLLDSSIKWLSHDGSVLNSSGVLILQSVNYTINGTMITCSVNSPQLINTINETITLTVQGERHLILHAALVTHLYSNISYSSHYCQPTIICC